MLAETPQADLNESLCELAQAVAEAVKVDVGPIRTELELVHSLLQDASVQLQRSFLNIDAQTRAQLRHVADFHENVKLERDAATVRSPGLVAGNPVQADIERFLLISQEVTGSVSDAVRALQFEDMATQLIACVQRRISRLDAVAVRLETIVAHFEGSPADAGSAARTSLGELRSQLCLLKSDYAIELVSPVSQGLDAGGSIDLF